MRELPGQPTLHLLDFAIDRRRSSESVARDVIPVLKFLGLFLRREPHQVFMPDSASPTRRDSPIHLPLKFDRIKVAKGHEPAKINEPEEQDLLGGGDAETNQRAPTEDKLHPCNFTGFSVNAYFPF